MTTTIKVLSAGAVQSMVEAIGGEFCRSSGHRIDLNFGTAGSLRDRISGGEAADLVILPANAINALNNSGMFAAGSVRDLARTVTGVAVREGAPVPDLSSGEAFKRALLAARAVSFSDPKAGGSSGTYFAGLLERMGIADEVNKKARLQKRGYLVAEAVAKGEADIGTTFISEMLTVKGVTVAGPLPPGMEFANSYTVAIMAKSAAPDGAAALARALTEPATRERWTAAGLEPAF